MKIYRQRILWDNVSLDVARFKQTLHSGSVIELAEAWKYGPCLFRLTIRLEFLREHHIDGKTLARLLPAWAKHHPAKSIGAKVTAFYTANSKVITRIHESGFIVGSDEWHDWQETQPDPFRNTRIYLESKYARAYA